MTTIAVLLGGLAWMGEQVATTMLGKSTDHLLAQTVRGLRDRVTWLAATPEAETVARTVREAHLCALERVIRDYREAAPAEWNREPHTRPELFFERAKAFCTRALRDVRNPSVRLDLGMGPMNEAIDGLLAKPLSDGPAAQRAALTVSLAEDAVLAELRAAITDVVLPPRFEEHFRDGANEKPRFLALFAAEVATQLKQNASFRDLVITGRLLNVQALALDARELMRAIEERFGGGLERVESKLEDQSRKIDEILARVSAEKGVPYEVLRTILDRLGEANVPDEQIAKRLTAKAEEFLALREQLSRISSARPDVTVVRSEAVTRIEAGDLAGARVMLRTAREQSRAVQARDEAMLLSDEAGVDRLELRYHAAADKFGEAASLVGALDPDLCFGYLAKQGSVLYDQGVEFGDNDALRSAVAVWNTAADLRPRESYPVEWAQVQNRRGSALAVLGDRESGTSCLEQAVAAFRAAEQAVAPKHHPLEWVRCQNNLANVLLSLADREEGTARIHQALAAYGSALEVISRDQEPFNWGMIQNNRGIALLNVARRENEAEFLEKAVAAFEAALEEWTRERGPLHWAIAQTNLGNALGGLGERESGSEHLDQAIAAYLAVLQVSTRERVPLEWALAQHNLANALTVRGRREHGITSLQQAITRFRAALEEVTRERAAFDWATTQHGLGEALAALGEKTGDAARMAEAVTAFRGALEVFEEAGAPYYLNGTRIKLEESLALLSNLAQRDHEGPHELRTN